MSEVRADVSNATPVAAETFGQKLARWIDDPFASVIVGLVAPSAAVAVVVTSIFGLALRVH
jgi:hypothetical protein